MTEPSVFFDDLWRAQMQRFSPRGKAVVALSDADRARLMDKVRARARRQGTHSAVILNGIPLFVPVSRPTTR